MARKTVTAAAAPAFIAADYNALVAAAVKACTAVDKAQANSAASVQAWALASAAAVIHKHKTLEDVKAALIAATPAKVRAANVAASGRDISPEGIEACGSTIKGHWYSFNAIAKGEALDRLLKGEAFTTLSRSIRADKKGATNKGKGATDKGVKASDVNDDTTAADTKAIPVPVTATGDFDKACDILADRLAHMSVAALKNTANDAALARLFSAIVKAQGIVAAADKAKAAKPVRAKKAAPAPLAIAA